jgi:asparagine synthetase B (glutamine-hydrolysing)
LAALWRGPRSLGRCCRIPSSLKVHLRRTKPLLFKTAEAYLPKEIIDRRKMSFAFPVGEWFRQRDALEPYLSLLRERRTADRGLSQPAVLNEVVEVIAEHRNGTVDHSEGALWTLVNLEVWARLFLDSDTLDEVTAAIRSA